MSSFKKYFLLIFLFVIFISKAQTSGYTFCDWDKIKLDAKYIPNENDTAIVFVSVRNYFPDKTEFLDYELDTTHTLHYFTIFFNQKKWVCVPKQNLEEAFKDVVKNKDIVVYGEGMGKVFPGNVDRATRLTRIYNVTTLMFDWPTYRPNLSGGRNYKLARIQSTEVAESFCKLFNELEKLKPNIKADSLNLSLLLHSLGNRLIKEGVTNNFIEVKTKLFDNIVLNAACVKKFGHKNWLEKLNIQNEIYLTRNNKDRTLNLARLAACTEQLGRHWGFGKAHNAIYLNFSPVLEREHNYFLLISVLIKHPDIKAIYADIFHGKSINFSDEKKFINQRNGRVITLKGPESVTQEGDIGIGISL